MYVDKIIFGPLTAVPP